MSMEKTLKEILDEILDEVEQELEEATTTAGVDGYNTPFAFGSGRKKDKKKEKETATQAGYTIAESVNEESYKVAGKPVTLIKGKKSNGTDWKVKFQNGKETSLSDVLSLIKPFPKGIKESINEVKVNYNFSEEELKRVLKLLGRSASTEVKMIKAFEKAFGRKLTRDELFESLNEAMKPSQVRSAISKVKKQLMRKWKQKGGYENFGQKELSQMKDKFDYNPYGSSDERQISKMLDGFDNWAMNYDGNMREDINEAKLKRPVNRWLELKNDDTMHPHKKMAMGLKELKYQLREVEKFFNWYNKIKTMNELDSQNYWKRTNNHIYTIKEKLIRIAKTIQEIEK